VGNTADVLLAEAPGGALLGAAVLLRRKGSRRERLYSLAVDPAARGRGVGRLLMEAVLACARSRGAVEVGLEVRTDNEGAIALYRSLGFTGAGVVEGYYADGSPALVMRRVEAQR
jgi:[ribosomal protein S18]-alanine N-acetyltransferase